MKMHFFNLLKNIHLQQTNTYKFIHKLIFNNIVVVPLSLVTQFKILSKCEIDLKNYTFFSLLITLKFLIIMNVGFILLKEKENICVTSIQDYKISI